VVGLLAAPAERPEDERNWLNHSLILSETLRGVSWSRDNGGGRSKDEDRAGSGTCPVKFTHRGGLTEPPAWPAPEESS
jgi:hypothetical protein